MNFKRFKMPQLPEELKKLPDLSSIPINLPKAPDIGLPEDLKSQMSALGVDEGQIMSSLFGPITEIHTAEDLKNLAVSGAKAKIDQIKSVDIDALKQQVKDFNAEDAKSAVSNYVNQKKQEAQDAMNIYGKLKNGEDISIDDFTSMPEMDIDLSEYSPVISG